MPRPLRIGYLVPQFPGQTHIFFWREVIALETMGHSVSLLSTRHPPDGLIAHDWSQDAMARTTYLGKIDPIHAIRALSRLSPKELANWIASEGLRFGKDVLVVLAAASRLYSEAKRKNLDHIHVHSCGKSALIAALCHKMGGPNYSLTLHGPLQDYGIGQRFKWSNAAFATIITQKLFDAATEELGDALPDQIAIRPMGVDTTVMKRSEPYKPVEHGQPMQLFSCGRLNVVKGHQDLMSAMRQLLDMGVDVRLEIAGEDDAGGTGYRAHLESHLKQLRLQDHVKLLGAIDAGLVRQKLLNAHAFVLASWHEPLGVAYMEAMACGVPTFGTEAGGVTELIADGQNGILVPPKNPSVLARALRDFSGNPELAMRLSEAGRAHVVENFSSTLGAEVLVDLINPATSDQQSDDAPVPELEAANSQ